MIIPKALVFVCWALVLSSSEGVKVCCGYYLTDSRNVDQFYAMQAGDIINYFSLVVIVLCIGLSAFLLAQSAFTIE